MNDLKTCHPESSNSSSSSCFFIVLIPLIIYITTYISISYIILRKELLFHFLIGRTGSGRFLNVQHNTHLFDLHRARFLFVIAQTRMSSAITQSRPSSMRPSERLAQFVTYSEGIVVDREAGLHLQALEVQVQRAVVAAGDNDEIAVEHLRIALAVAAQNCLHVAAQFRVAVPTLLVGVCFVCHF